MPEASTKSSNNRSSLMFIAGVSLVAGLAIYSDGWGQFMASKNLARIETVEVPELQPGRGLTSQDWEAARTAWRYFEQNYQESTGLVDSVSGYPSGTMWDQGSYLLALVAARQMNIIDQQLFETRTHALLAALSRLELFQGQLPNKVYNTITLQPVDYENHPVEGGIGWSALDIGRMLSALRILEVRAPSFSPDIRRLLSSWQLDAMAQNGELIGTSVVDGEVLYRQEGRIGYEQYAARAAAMWGLDTLAAGSAYPILKWEKVNGTEVPVDKRKFSDFRAITPTLSEPYFLQALEMGFNAESEILAHKVYLAQESRYRETNIITMVSEGNIDQAPHFLYASVHGNGKPWNVLAEKGEEYTDLRFVSLKAAFAWNAIYNTPYTQLVLSQLDNLKSEKGWNTGTYESDGRSVVIFTANTNAVVLQALHFKFSGNLFSL